MIKYRRGCFETNSSSTHAFVIDTRKESFKYTNDHFEAFTEIILPYTSEECSKWDDPVILTDLKDKVRYFWTIFLKDNFGEADESALQFMGRLQKILPQAIFAYKFPPYNGQFNYHYIPDEIVAYLEDSNYVLNDTYDEDISNWSEETLREFLAEGALIFGDRDLMDYYNYQSKVDTAIEQRYYKLIEKISG